MSLINFNSFKLCLKTLGNIPLKSQIRTTFVLKRRNNITLSKLEDKGYKKFRTRDYIYDFVEYESVVKQKKIPVLLTSYVEGLGECGDIVEVKPFYARNSLLLPHLAVYPSEDNLKEYAKEIEARKHKELKSYSSPFASLMIKILSKKCISIDVNDSEPWTIEPWHIRLSLRKLGIIVPESSIRLPETPITGPDSDKENKEFAVQVKINNTEEVPVRCRIHHLGVERSETWYLEDAEALFSDQKDLLRKMPRQDTITKLKNNQNS